MGSYLLQSLLQAWAFGFGVDLKVEIAVSVVHQLVGINTQLEVLVVLFGLGWNNPANNIVIRSEFGCKFLSTGNILSERVDSFRYAGFKLIKRISTYFNYIKSS